LTFSNGNPAGLRLRKITPADHLVMPWKNGLGTTREIAIDPQGASMADAAFRWRLSIADVAQSGPFSSFPGIDRTIMVVKGNGMVLSVAGRPPKRLDRCFVPYQFSGDAATECNLIDGPIQDFNR
jgi:environmental stress-induced protein Ves